VDVREPEELGLGTGTSGEREGKAQAQRSEKLARGHGVPFEMRRKAAVAQA